VKEEARHSGVSRTCSVARLAPSLHFNVHTTTPPNSAAQTTGSRPHPLVVNTKSTKPATASSGEQLSPWQPAAANDHSSASADNQHQTAGTAAAALPNNGCDPLAGLIDAMWMYGWKADASPPDGHQPTSSSHHHHHHHQHPAAAAAAPTDAPHLLPPCATFQLAPDGSLPLAALIAGLAGRPCRIALTGPPAQPAAAVQMAAQWRAAAERSGGLMTYDGATASVLVGGGDEKLPRAVYYATLVEGGAIVDLIAGDMRARTRVVLDAASCGGTGGGTNHTSGTSHRLSGNGSWSPHAHGHSPAGGAIGAGGLAPPSPSAALGGPALPVSYGSSSNLSALGPATPPIASNSSTSTSSSLGGIGKASPAHNPSNGRRAGGPPVPAPDHLVVGSSGSTTSALHAFLPPAAAAAGAGMLMRSGAGGSASHHGSASASKSLVACRPLAVAGSGGSTPRRGASAGVSPARSVQG